MSTGCQKWIIPRIASHKLDNPTQMFPSRASLSVKSNPQTPQIPTKQSLNPKTSTTSEHFPDGMLSVIGFHFFARAVWVYERERQVGGSSLSLKPSILEHPTPGGLSRCIVQQRRLHEAVPGPQSRVRNWTLSVFTPAIRNLLRSISNSCGYGLHARRRVSLQERT